MIPYLRVAYGNPSSTHSFGREAKSTVELSRKNISKTLDCNPSEIFFTSGGTEANNLSFHIAVNALKVDTIISAKSEHKAVLNVIKGYKDTLKIEFVRIDNQGKVDLIHLEQLLKTNPNALVSLMMANNEIGTLLPIIEVNSLVGKYNAFFHTDAVQIVGHYKIDLKKLNNITFLTSSAHKFHGPKGVGFLFIRKGTKLTSLIKGGSQERELRAGTENVMAIAGLNKAFEIAYHDLEERKTKIASLKKYLKDQLQAHFPEILLNGADDENCLYTILNVSFPSFLNRDMLPFELDLKGIAVSAGSACSSGSTSFSHVLKAINQNKDWPAIRFSLSHLNTKEEIDILINALLDINAT
jgi:cysteine desulfurase